jgi:murein DD-endopeptidase MepM/ murein hydrolase activator NlpD
MTRDIRILPMLLLVLNGCATGEQVRDSRRAPRPTAVRSARSIHLASTTAPATALRPWEEAGSRALRSNLSIALSFHERLAFPAEAPHAASYRFQLTPGQSLHVQVSPIGGAPKAFADMHQEIGGDIFRPVHWDGEGGDSYTFIARVAGTYVLRVQPPPRSAAEYDVAVTGGRTLTFPVADADASAIRSAFGDPRDAGARAHEGVDIFAPRGTPVLAAADGYIEKARNTPTGGLVVWQADASSSVTYYYAHLDELLVRDGERVRAGDPIGRVGNTGNARGASPHLHFAIYLPGTVPLDPAPFLAAGASAWPTVPIAVPAPGTMTVVAGDRVRLRRSPSPAGAIITELSSGTQLLVLGASGNWQRVVLADGTSGFIAARLTDDSSGSDR